MTNTSKTDLHIAYVRVSSEGQNTGRQLAEVTCSLIFTDKLSGATKERPELQKLLSDSNLSALHNVTLHVHSLDRLARNLQDLQSLVQHFLAKGWTLIFHKENLTFASGTGSAMNTLLLQMLGAVAEFERSLIKERQREGIAIAKQKGVYKGRAPVLTVEQIANLKERAIKCTNKSSLAKEFGISRVSLYKYLNFSLLSTEK
jgi:DNA invertase Pin-like site-specific DNA recombinase